MKRIFDLTVVLAVLVIGAVPLALLAVLVKLTSKGPVLYWSDRIGRHNRIFRMPKFRTMRVDTPEVASHLLLDPDRWLTPIGGLLRRASLDELPQLWSVLVGHMSFVGPRPALHNQHDLIALRTFHGVEELIPGLTGWAQINGRDEASIPDKVALDVHYFREQSFWFDLKIVALTAIQVIRGKGTSVPKVLRGGREETVPAEAFLCSAASWFRLRDYERCLADCKRAIQLAPNNAIAYNNRGVCRASRGEFAEAFSDYETAIILDAHLAAAFYNRGLAWLDQRDETRAGDDFARAVELVPDDIRSHDAMIEFLGRNTNDSPSTVLIADRREGIVDLEHFTKAAKAARTAA